MLKDEQISQLIDLLSILDTRTKIYLGCDSIRYLDKREKYAKYATVLIVHINGNNGCKIFSNVTKEPDFDLRKDRPKMRLIKEAHKVCEMYIQVAPLIDEFDIEIHLDINTDPLRGSNCAASEAAGYVLGMTGIQPKLKPEGFAASYAADGVAHGKTHKLAA